MLGGGIRLLEPLAKQGGECRGEWLGGGEAADLICGVWVSLLYKGVAGIALVKPIIQGY